MRKKWWFLKPILTIFFLFPAFCVYAQQPQYGGILRVIEPAEGGQPIGAPWLVRGIDSNLIRPVVEFLIREDINANYHPWLAVEWKVDQKNHTVTLSLRRGVKFHDGTDFNAETVKWCLDNAITAKTITGFKSVDVIDSYTVRVNLERYRNNVFNVLSSSVTGIVSPTAYSKMGKDQAMWYPVGTGPFKFVNYERGSKVTFTKWDGYWQKGKPYLDGFQYFLIRDPMTQQAALMASGEEKVHILGTTSGEVASVMKARGFKILSHLEGMVALYPDSANPDSPLSKKKVRQALSYAIDREAIVKARGFGFLVPADQVIPEGRPGHVKGSDLGRHDINKARQLLAEAGYPNGFRIKIIAQPALVDRDAVVAIQREFQKIGVEAELEFPDAGKYNAYRLKDGWKNGFLAQGTRILSTTNITYNFFFHTYAGQFPSLKRPEGFVEKLEVSLSTLLPEKAKMEELSRMLIDDITVIPIYYQPEFRITQPNVFDTGYFEWSGSTVFTPERIWLGR